MIYIMIGIVLLALFGGITLNILKFLILIPIGLIVLLWVFVILAAIIIFFKLYRKWERFRDRRE